MDSVICLRASVEQRLLKRGSHDKNRAHPGGTLELMLKLISSDKSMSQIADELDRQSFRTWHGTAWTQTPVFKMLPSLIQAAPQIWRSSSTQAECRRNHSAVHGGGLSNMELSDCFLFADVAGIIAFGPIRLPIPDGPQTLGDFHDSSHKCFGCPWSCAADRNSIGAPQYVGDIRLQRPCDFGRHAHEDRF